MSEATSPRPARSRWADLWTLDPDVVFLNHGSFGACPRAVLEAQARWRERLERQPLLFLGRELEPLLAASREVLADFVHVRPEDLAFVPNATSGVNTVLRSLALLGSSALAGVGKEAAAAVGIREGDELLVTNHEYNACANALRYTAECTGAKIVLVRIPFPLSSEEEAVEAILGAVTSKTRLFLIDHITSPTALVFPMERIVRELAERGIDTLVDGAHGPGMLPLDLTRLGAAYYTGNCHKWLCTPKGAGFLHVRADRKEWIRPLAISHGANSPRRDRSLFELEFDWTGTGDPSPFLCVGESIRFLGSLLPGGWPELMEHNRTLARAGREILCRALEIPPPCPEAMLGSMATLPLPPGDGQPLSPPLYLDPLQTALWEEDRIEVPIVPWPFPDGRAVRISAQLYNSPEQYEALARALRRLIRK